MRVFTIGRSEEGRDIILLAIADEKGIQTAETLMQSLSPEETSAEWYRVLPPPTGR